MTRSEAELLLLAARRSRDELPYRIRAAIDEGQFDWEWCLQQADRHGLTAMMAELLLTAPEVAQDFRDRLREPARQVGRASLVLVVGLLEVEGLLRSHGIIAVPFKGPALAAAAYGNVGLRHSLDLDLVVRRRDAIRAKRLLGKEGFRGGPVSTTMMAAWVRHGRSVTLQRADGLIIDLQWAADLSEALDMDVMFERLGTLELGGSSIPAFSDEDLLLMLCVHGCKHLWSHLYWVSDLAELIAARRWLDWGRLFAEAERARALRRLLVGLALVERLQSTALPTQVQTRIRADPRARVIADRIWARMFEDRGEPFPLSPLHLRMRDSWRGSATYAWRLAVTPTDDDWRWLQLPGGLWWLYPPLRPIRLGLKYRTRHATRTGGTGRRRARPR